ncbi:MAG: M20/M25/M40 family metallo-hydrolase [Acidobacteria bacterium]|nr:M20/M25/M40 family metallo-hydrolase [Acidobacteriota bacterium]
MDTPAAVPVKLSVLKPATLLLFSFFLFAFSAFPQTQLDAHQQLAHDIFKQLVDIDTTDQHGNVTTAAQAVVDRLRAAGFPAADIQLVGPSAKKMNVVARIHGQGSAKPTLWLAHLDVVEARKEDWSQGLDPFQFTEKDAYYYGRGTSDIKDGASILVANFIRLKQEGYRPAGDLILALTADEEGGSANGVDWLIKNRRDLIDAAYCVNLDGGDANKYNGVRKVLTIQAAEKSYADYQLLATNRGGHSSQPRPDNAIYELTHAIDNIGAYSFPVHLNEITKGYFAGTASIESGQTATDMKALAAGTADDAAIARLSTSPLYNSLMRTTCVPTMITAGHARNALPQRAEANVNCRIVPEETPDSVLAQLQKVANSPKVEITIVKDNGIQPVVAPLAKLRPEVVSKVKDVTAQVFPGVIVMPEMSTGASDGKYLTLAGIQTYGISGLFDDVNDVRAHGRDERIAIKDYYDGLEFNYRLIKALNP